jgi:hypothetical protein
MTVTRALAATAVTLLLFSSADRLVAQGDAGRAQKGGGILAPGWKGRVDAESAAAGQSINDSRFEMRGSTIKLTTGPAAVYWNPANAGSGSYTVKATFREPKSWPADDHPHPYGIFIGGTNLDTDAPSLVYCVAYADGRLMVRGFSKGTVFTPLPVKRDGNPAVHKAEPGGGVTQEIMWTVKGGRAECSINGAVVAGFNKSELVGPGTLESFDGVAGIRVALDLDIEVTQFAVTKN